MLVDIFVPLGSFAMILGIVYIIVMSLHKEKMSLIEHGIDINSLKRRPNRYSILKGGMFFVGIAIGTLMGSWAWNYFKMDPAVAFISMILLFGGAALVSYYLIERKLKKETNEISDKSE